MLSQAEKLISPILWLRSCVGRGRRGEKQDSFGYNGRKDGRLAGNAEAVMALPVPCSVLCLVCCVCVVIVFSQE